MVTHNIVLMRRAVNVITALLILSLISSMVWIKPTQAFQSDYDGILRINSSAYQDTLDPQRAWSSYAVGHLKLIYEGLTRLDAGSNTVAGSAESWEYNQNATQITFRLREGLQYSDGTLLNAMNILSFDC